MNNCVKFAGWLKSFLQYINIFDIPRLAREISCDVKHIREKYDETITSIEKYKEALQLEKENRQKERNLFLSVLDHLDDMIWAKDIYGKYIVANRAFREKFCYGILWDDLQGKTDVELSVEFKKLVGEENHTFGEMCANSDILVQQTRIPQKFLEEGNINGKLMKLVVNKSPVFNYQGEMFATCGSGRDVTEWHDAVEKAIQELRCECSCFKQEDVEKILNELNKFKFREGDHVK